jgi:hypothetical protein
VSSVKIFRSFEGTRHLYPQSRKVQQENSMNLLPASSWFLAWLILHDGFLSAYSSTLKMEAKPPSEMSVQYKRELFITTAVRTGKAASSQL